MSDKDSKDQKPEDKKSPHVAYVGRDRAYWDNIQIAFRELLGQNVHGFKFTLWEENENFKIQQVCPKILEVRPDILFVDLSSNLEALLFLAKTIKRQQCINPILIIGLISPISTKITLERCMVNGPDYTFYKGLDYHSIVYAPCCHLMGEDFKVLEKVTIRMKQDSGFRDFLRINYITEKDVRFESDLQLNPGEKILIDSHLDPKIMPILFLKIISRDQKEIFYDYTNAYNAQIDWEDKQLPEKFLEHTEYQKQIPLGFPPKGKLTPEQVASRNSSLDIYGEKIKKSVAGFEKWIKQEGLDYVDAKRVRVLTIDRKGVVFTQVERLFHEYPFSLRWQSILEKPKDLLGSVRPQIITYLLESKSDPIEIIEKIPPAERKDGHETRKKVVPGPATNDFDNLIQLIKSIKSLAGYNPFVILFQTSKKQVSDVQSQASYSNLLNHPGAFSLQVVLSLSALLDKKLKDAETKEFEGKLKIENEKRMEKFKQQGGGYFQPAKISEVIPPKKYFKKGVPESWGFVNGTLEIRIMSENDILFKASKKFAIGSIIQIVFPATFYITVVNPQRSQNSEVTSQGLQRGIIHGLEAKEKERLSKYINTIYAKYFANNAESA